MLNSDKPFPFFLHYEQFNIAWLRTHNGYFIDPNGTVYAYDHKLNCDIYNKELDEKWHYFDTKTPNETKTFWGDEKDGFIKKDDLYENLSLMHRLAIKPLKFSQKIDEIEKSIRTSPFDQGTRGCDRGISAYTLLIYNENEKIYDRLIIKTYGNNPTSSLSPYVKEVLAYFRMYTDTKISSSDWY